MILAGVLYILGVFYAAVDSLLEKATTGLK